MMNKKPLKSFSTGTVVALGLSLNSFYLAAQEAESPFENKPGNTETQTKRHKHKHAEHKMKEGMCGSSMRMDMKGMVMYENKTTIPKDCPEISEDITIKVIANTKYSDPYPGTIFGFDQHQWQVKPCARITVEFTNDDEIRHQWMVHGLPKYLYPEGMFHLEVNGPGKKTGTFIVPNSHYTYLVHCDIAQHMEKGMKAQLIVGNGRGNLPSIPGISDPTFPDSF